MSDVLHIGEDAWRLRVAPEHPRMLGREGRIQREGRDPSGCVYPEPDLARLRANGEGRRLRRLRGLEKLPGATP